MSTTVKAGWLKDKDGNKFAPKTMASQVINNDGTLLTAQIDSDLANLEQSLKDYTDEQIAGIGNVGDANHAATADSATKATQDGNGNVISSTYETKTDAQTKFDNAKAYVDNALADKSDSNHNHDDMYYTESEIDGFLGQLAASQSDVAEYAINRATSNAKDYTDEQIAGLGSVGGGSQIQFITWEETD